MVFLWRLTTGLENEINLHFMIPGDSKNRCDGAFRLIKRKLKETTAITPKDMEIISITIIVVSESSMSNVARFASDVDW